MSKEFAHRFKDALKRLAVIVSICFASAMITAGVFYISGFLIDFPIEDSTNYSVVSLSASILAIVVGIITFSETIGAIRRGKLEKERLIDEIYDELNNKSSTIKKVIRYSRQRWEIDEEIHRLMGEMKATDADGYVRLNRLVYSGQNADNDPIGANGANIVNYAVFLKQFGIQPEKMSVEKNNVVFLTAFNQEGDALFEQCQIILGRMNIFLRKTDNIVETDDIMMNIVSLIVRSEWVLVNIDGRNPNVYYELGIAHALGKPTIILSKKAPKTDEKAASTALGFDIRQKRVIFYQDWDNLERQLLYQIGRLKSA